LTLSPGFACLIVCAIMCPFFVQKNEFCLWRFGAAGGVAKERT